MDPELRARLDRLISAMETDRGRRGGRRGGGDDDSDEISGSGTSFRFDMSKLGPDFEKLGEKLEKVIDGLQKKFDEFQGTITSFGMDIYRLYEKLDQARAALATQTGLFEQASGIYSKLSGQLRGLGMDYSDIAGHVADLIEKIPEFLSLTRDQQEAIGLQSAKLKKLGVDFQSYSNTLVYLTKSQGQTQVQSQKTIDSLVRLGMALGKPPKAIMSEYSSAIEKLAVFGNQSRKVFTESEVIATKLGVSMEKVLGVMDNFNTFEDAADAAGNFNIALGKNLINTQELTLATDPTTRLKMVAKALQDFRRSEGVAFNQLSVQRQRAAATALKIDVDTLSRLDKLNLSNAESLEKRVKVAADGTISYEKNVKATITTAQRLEALKDQVVGAFLPLLKYFQPILSSVAQLAGMFVKAIQNLGNQFPGFTKLLAGVTSAFVAYKALSSAGILGEDGIINKFTKSVMQFIPFGQQLSGFIFPALGVAMAGLAAKAGGAQKLLTEKAVLGNKTLQNLFGLSDDNVKAIQAKIDEVTKFVRESFDNLLANLGFDKADRDGIIESIRKTFEDLYNTMEGIFGKIMTIGGSFIGTFSKTMKALSGDDSKGPLTKIVISVTEGLRQVIAEISAALKPSNNDSVLGEALGTLSTTFEEFGNKILDVLKSSFGGFFSKLFPENVTSGGGGGPMAFISNLVPDFVKNWLAGEGINGLSELMSNVFGGLGSIFTGASSLMTNPIDPKKLAEQVSGILMAIATGLGGKIQGSGWIWDDSVLDRLWISRNALAGVKDLGAAIKDLSAGLKGLGADSGKKIGEFFASFPEIKPVQSSAIDSITKLAEALQKLNVQLKDFAPLKEHMAGINTSPEAAQNVQTLAVSVDQYVSALTKLRGLTTEEQAIKDALRDLGKAFSDIKLELDSEKIGEKIAEVIKREVFGGG